MFFRVNQYFDFIIVNAENTTSHKCIIQNDRSMLRAPFKTIGNSVLIIGQNSCNDFFSVKFKSATLTLMFQIKHFLESMVERYMNSIFTC